MLRDLATGAGPRADPGLGPLGRLDRLGAATAGACWSPPSDTLEEPVFRVDAATGQVTRLTGDGHYGNVHAARRRRRALRRMNSIMAPDDLYRARRRAARSRQLTDVNRDAARPARPGHASRSSASPAPTTTRVWGWTLKPADATGTLPIAFLVHGGPQGSFGNSWSYRWNPRLFTAPGYAVVSVDFHGSTGYGQAFTDAIHHNWGGWPLEDLQKGLAFATAHDPQLDADNACALGGSYGGYMMNWIEGQWPDRFKCIVQHDGVFDARAMAYETEELWFDEWEHGGKAYYEAPAEFEKWNPVNYVAELEDAAAGRSPARRISASPTRRGSPPSPRSSAATSRRGC